MIKKVLIVEDHRLMRTALRRLLTTMYDPQPEILEASEGREALKLLKANPDIDVTILDIQMSGMNGIDTLKAIKMSHHKTGIAMLTQYDHSSLIETAYELGANAFLLKNCGPEELKEAMTAAANGEIFVNDLFGARKKAQKTLHHRSETLFSAREVDVLRLIAKGKSSNTIAEDLGISVATVLSYRKQLLSKSKTQNTAELIALGYQLGLI